MLDPLAHPHPFNRLTTWLDEHLATSKLKHPTACVLSTVGLDGFPNARNVALKEFSVPYLFITGAINTRKGLEIAEDPKVAVTFWWEETARQIRIQGKATQITFEKANFYFSERPKEAQALSVVSAQGAALTSTGELEQKHNKMLETYKDTPILRPENWGGYKINPNRVEFLEFKDSRFHERLLYTKNKEGWNAVRLQP